MKSNKRMWWAIVAFKYMPVIAVAILVWHVAALLIGNAGVFAENTVAMPVLPAAVALLWSWAFGYCWLHKAMLVYILIVDTCMWYEQVFGFGALLAPMRWTVLLMGIALLVTLVIRWNKYRDCNGRYDIHIKNHFHVCD